jgi:hypothetical protein
MEIVLKYFGVLIPISLNLLIHSISFFKNLQEWRDTSLNTLKEFNQNKGMHAIFVSKEMLDCDSEFEESLLG